MVCFNYRKHKLQIGVISMSEHKIGFIRNIDKLGRLCIPVELRSSYDMHTEAPIEMIPVPDGILLCKVESVCAFCRKKKELTVTFKNKRICRSCLDALSTLRQAPESD